MKRLPIPDPILFQPLALGALNLAHRMVMPAIEPMIPLDGGVPSQALVKHYGDRATFGGLLITQATLAVSDEASSDRVPGLHDTAQVNGWRDVTAAVHRQGGLAIVHLHVPNHLLRSGADADRVMRGLRRAAENAGDAGFDGIELDAGLASLSSRSSSDRVERVAADRDCLLFEMVETLAGVCGSDRLGVWLAPNGAECLEDIHALLEQQSIAYVHSPAGALHRVLGAESHAAVAEGTARAKVILRGISLSELPTESLKAGVVDAVSHGAAFLANADLPRRLLQGLPVQAADAEA